MSENYQIDAQWDDEAHVWIATSADAPGLVIEADSWAKMIEEVRLTLPELLGTEGRPISLTFKAEAHLDLAVG